MDRAIGILSVLCLSLAAAACGFARYRYFSLDAPGVVVAERGKPDLPRLHIASLPLRYSMERDTYHLEISLPSKAYRYLPTLEVRPSAAATLLVRLACRSNSPQGCVGCGPVENDPRALMFTGFMCSDTAPGEARISFDVLDLDGSVIATEHIPFTLKLTGFYW
jgi:hypothetical protein